MLFKAQTLVLALCVLATAEILTFDAKVKVDTALADCSYLNINACKASCKKVNNCFNRNNKVCCDHITLVGYDPGHMFATAEIPIFDTKVTVDTASADCSFANINACTRSCKDGKTCFNRENKVCCATVLLAPYDPGHMWSVSECFSCKSYVRVGSKFAILLSSVLTSFPGLCWTLVWRGRTSMNEVNWQCLDGFRTEISSKYSRKFCLGSSCTIFASIVCLG